MKNYIFLIDKDNYNERVYFAIPADKIERLKVSDTYDRNGQQVSPEDAGDSVILNTPKAVDLANEVENEDGESLSAPYNIGDYVYAYEKSHIFSAIVDNCEEYVDYTVYAESCDGFNYWDGHNWKSVIVGYEWGAYTSWQIVEDEELCRGLNEAIESADYVHEGHGTTHYVTDEYIIIQTAFASDWSTYQISEK